MSPDAGGRDGGTPEIRSLAPCPVDWVETATDDGRAIVCEPFPDGVPTCAHGTAPTAGSSTCRTIGRACTADDFGAAPASGSVLYVDPDAEGGDGSRERPFDSLAEAISLAEPGSIVLLSKGDHPVPDLLSVPAVTIRGACAAETTLGLANGLIGTELTLEDLTLLTEPLEGAAAPIILERLIVLRGIEAQGLVAIGAERAEATDIAVRAEVVEAPSVLSFGVGALGARIDLASTVGPEAGWIYAQSEVGAVEVSRVALTAERDSQLWLTGSAVTLRELASVGPGATFVRSDVEPFHVEDAALHDMGLSQYSIGDGRIVTTTTMGLVLQSAGTAERVSIQRVTGFPLVATTDPSVGADYDVDLRQLVISDVVQGCIGETPCHDEGGYGIVAVTGGTLRVEGFRISRAAPCGIFLAETGALDLFDGEVRDSTIGACVQVGDFDLSRLSNGVLYLDNGMNLDTTELPVPTPRPLGL